MRLLTSHDPANMTRLGMDVVAAGVAFGLVVLVVFAIARIGDSRKVPAACGYGGSPEGDRRPATGGIPRARQVIRARHIAGAPPGPAPRWRPGRRQRSRRSRRRSAFRSAARAEPDERVLTGRPARRAQGWSRARDARRPGHPGNPADRRTAAAPEPPGAPAPGAGPGSASPGAPAPGAPGGRSQDRPSPGWAGAKPPRPGYQPGMNPGGPGRAPYAPGGQPPPPMPPRDHMRPREAPRPGHAMPPREAVPSREGMPPVRACRPRGATSSQNRRHP